MRYGILLFIIFGSTSALAAAPSSPSPTLSCLRSMAEERQLSNAAAQWRPTETLIRGDALALTFRTTFEAAIRHENALIALNEQHKIVFEALRPYFLKPDQAYEKFFQDLNRYDRQVQGCNRQAPVTPPPLPDNISPPPDTVKPLSSVTAMQQILQKNPEYLGPLKTTPTEGGGIPVDPKLLNELLARVYAADQAAMIRAQAGATLTSLMNTISSGVTESLQSLSEAGLTLDAMQKQVPTCFPTKTPDKGSVFSEKFSLGVSALLKRPLPFDSSGVFKTVGCQAGIQNTDWLLPENRAALAQSVLKQHSQMYDATTRNWMVFQQKIQRQDYALRRQQRSLARGEAALAQNPSLKNNTFFMSALNSQRQSVKKATKNLKTMQADYDKMVPPSVAKAEAQREKMATFFMTLSQAGLEGLSPTPLSLAQRKANLKQKAAAYIPAADNQPYETPRVLDAEIGFARAYAAKAKQFLDYYTQNPTYTMNPRILQISCAITTRIERKRQEISGRCPKPPSSAPQRR
jgi:cell division septum initiation protein DivIVA